MNRFARFLKGVAKDLDPKTGWVRYTGNRRIENFYTGYEFGGKAKIVGTIGTLAYGGYVFDSTNDNLTKMQAGLQDVESLPGTRGDMLGYKANTGIDPNFGATGDLVFALHRLRHGG